MALLKATFTAELVAAFSAQAWGITAQLFTSAVNNYILSATATVPVTGTVTPPSGSPYPAIGTGVGNPVTTASAGLYSACISAFASPLWATLAGIIVPAIETLMITSTLVTTVTGVLQGTGTLVAWTAPGGGALLTTMNIAFTTGQLWSQVAVDIADAVDIYLKTVVVSTVDAGIIPPSSWVGTGAGGVLS